MILRCCICLWRASVLVSVVSCLVVSGCDGGVSDEVAVDAGQERDGEVQGVHELDGGAGSPWDQYDWQPIRGEGDPAGDCQAEDASCGADLAQLYFAVQQGILYLDLRFHGPFPVDQGTFEIFLIPPDQQVVGHSVQVIAGDTQFWDVDCRSIASLQKHNGCHWSPQALPSSFRAEWIGAERYVLEVVLEPLGFGALSELKVGVGAAPFEIEFTAEFTDRYPDQVWVTATEVRGLQTIPLVQ